MSNPESFQPNRAVLLKTYPSDVHERVMLVVENIVFVDMSTQPGTCFVLYENGFSVSFQYDLCMGSYILGIIYHQCNEVRMRSNNVKSMYEVNELEQALKSATKETKAFNKNNSNQSRKSHPSPRAKQNTTNLSPNLNL
jgi:hypothetical protein